MSSDAPPQIDYAPPLPARRRLLRRWTPRVLLLALLASTYFWGPPVWDRALTLYWQRRCLTYRAPADQVVVDVPFSPGASVGRAQSGAVPVEWSRFYQRLSAPGFQSQGTVFLHELRSPAGERYLVVVDYVGSGPPFEPTGNTATFTSRLFGVPGGVRTAVQSDFRLNIVPIQTVEPRHPPDARRLVLFAGQPDETDPTHFTIRYRHGESEGIIDGWLRKGAVALEPRATARVTPPPPPSAASSRAPAPPASTRPARPPTAGG